MMTGMNARKISEYIINTDPRFKMLMVRSKMPPRSDPIVVPMA